MNYVSSIKNVSERLSTLNEYVEKLEQEIQNMNAWDPHYCILLLKDGNFGVLREEGEKMRQKMECEESKAPTLKINFDDEEERAVILGKVAVKEKNRMNTTNKNRQKSAAEIPKPYKLSIGGGAFTPYKSSGPSFSATLSTMMKVKRDKEMETAEGSSSPLVPPRIKTSRVKMSHRHIVPDVKEIGSQRENQAAWKNKRRCWSPELHASFMAAAQLLGGPQVATPKQIRRIMQVGLTNDQVKSHLQVVFQSILRTHPKVRLQNKDPQVPNIEAANQHNAKPANQQAWFQDSWAAEGQSGQSWNTRTYSSLPQCPLNLAGPTGEICSVGNVYEEDKEAKPGSCWFRCQFHIFGEDDIQTHPARILQTNSSGGYASKLMLINMYTQKIRFCRFHKESGSLSPSFMFKLRDATWDGQYFHVKGPKARVPLNNGNILMSRFLDLVPVRWVDTQIPKGLTTLGILLPYEKVEAPKSRLLTIRAT
ncbi:hypothetical protein AAG906_013329 [Vitis piasezkii]